MFDTIDFSTEIADERMELNVSKNVDECLVISENDTRKEFLNVNANKAKGPDGLTGKILKTYALQLCHIYSHTYIQYSAYPYQLPPFPTFGKLQK